MDIKKKRERERNNKKMFYLLSAIAGKVEGKHGEKRYSHAWDDDVYRVEKCFPAHRYVKGDVQIRLVATCVKFFVPVNSEKKNKKHYYSHSRVAGPDERECNKFSVVGRQTEFKWTLGVRIF